MVNRDQTRPAAGSQPLVEVLIADEVAAAIAAHAANQVSGVARLEPRLTGVLTDIATHMRARLNLGDAPDPAPTDGVEATVTDGSVTVHIDLAVTADAHATAVAHRVQQAVAAALRTDAGLNPATIIVTVLDIHRSPHPTPGSTALPVEERA